MKSAIKASMKAKMEAALNKATVPKKKVETASVIAMPEITLPEPDLPLGEAVKSTVVEKALDDIMSKKKKPVEKIDIIPELLSGGAKASDGDDEGMPSGFLGRYTQKLTKK